MGEALTWWITLQLLGLIAFPVASVALRGLPDRGWAVSKVLGLLLVGWLGYTLAMLQMAQFGRGLLIFCAVGLAAFSLWILLRNGKEGWSELRAYLARPSMLRYIIASEAIFTVAFIGWAWYRAHDPEIFGLEKFMDFGFMNSITISGSFPPNDMWLAGHPINYYYFGYVLMASLSLLAGVSTTVGYNLANVTLFALTALGSFGVAYNMAVTIRATRERPAPVAAAAVPARASTRLATRAVRERELPAATKGKNGKALPVRRTTTRQSVSQTPVEGQSIAPSRSAPVAVLDEEPVTVAVDGHEENGVNGEEIPPELVRPRVPPAYEAGNDGPRDERRIGVVPFLAAILAMLMITVMSNLSVPFATHNGPNSEGNGWTPCLYCFKPNEFNWWSPSRIIRDYTTVDTGQGPVKNASGIETINEFPLFSFLINDMHPHVMALPLVFLALSGALAFSRRKVLRGRNWLDGLPRGWQAWLAMVVVALVIGSLYAANTWDYPTYLLIALIGIGVPLLARQRASDTPSGWRWLRPWIVQSGILIALSLITFSLFHLTFKSLVGGQPGPLPENVRNIPLVGWVLERLSGFLLVNTADKTITGFVVIFGVFLVAIIGWLIYEVAVHFNARRAAGTLNWGEWSVPIVAILSLLFAFVLRFPLLGLLFPIMYTCFYLLWRDPGDRVRAFALGMTGLAALIGLTIEVVFLNDVFKDRQNTLFKFYYQLWVIWGLSASYGIFRVWSRVFSPIVSASEAPPDRRRAQVAPDETAILAGRSLAGVWVLTFVFLFVSSLTYLIYGTQSKVNWQFTMRGLDGTEHLSRSAPGDYEAIMWLRANGTGRDRVLECCHDEYNNPGHAGRVSSYTGIPTLISWDGHENQWRGGQPDLLSLLGPRRQTVNGIYAAAPPADNPQGLLQTLRENGVSYVFVGAVERGEGAAAGAFDYERVTPRAEELFKQVLTEAFRSTTGNTVIYRVPPATGNVTGGNRP